MIEKQRIIDIYNQFEIPWWDRGKNVTRGWINISCPFCSDHSNHCGVNPATEFFNCWRCGRTGHFIDLLMRLTNLPYKECESIISKPSVASVKGIVEDINKIFTEDIFESSRVVKNKTVLPERFELIAYNTEFSLLNRYLERRVVSIDTVIKHGCGICRSGPFMNRLIIPVTFQGEVVAFQAADLTGFARIKYKTSTNQINNYLYGYDEFEGKKAILVEGVLDAWRVGKNALATFGTHVTDRQKRLILEKKLDELYFIWDEDAYLNALWKVADYFKTRIRVVEVILLSGGHDPDSFGRENGVEKIYQLIEEMKV